ncbi:MAG: hypothetical protein KBH41_16700 [Azonexus sp.]|nr:hypothetical protein [Azonexus sp.]
MELSKTMRALKLLDSGMSVRQAALGVGVSEQAIYTAKKRQEQSIARGKVRCPCCQSLVPADRINLEVDQMYIDGQPPFISGHDVGTVCYGCEKCWVKNPNFRGYAQNDLRMAHEEAEMRYCAVKVHDPSRIMQGMKNVLSQPNDQG